MIIDVSDWEIDEAWTTGTREKKWLIESKCENKSKWLFKEPKIVGEMYAEVASYKIGTNVFYLNMPKTEFAIYNNSQGIISKSFLQKYSNFDYIESVDYFGPDFDIGNLLTYTIDSAIQIVRSFRLEYDFVSMCIFDYLIANQDRHCENWGILESKARINNKIMAPIYDCGSSMFNGYDDASVKDLFNDKKRFEAYTNKSKSIFTVDGKRKPKSEELLKFLIKDNEMLFRKCFSRYRECTYDIIYRSIKDIPIDIMTNERKKLVSKLIIYRISTISNLLERGEKLC
ncbi:hypothetical protein SAMN04488700_0210 [Carnobacterium iners]|uniref:Uncharacterized protein n=1 Tax=Carnobacterium iners TaxID=1073423 RepID=A0A1X7MP65_9LACT|nr:HipA domain-containing protein [Carnobacterium iners]SEK94780.1 hypothetical protein SAMN04488114_11734 [Carnobacterium iners]SMH26639.1 hypothetical protein SAMN04488700_0210 [Carnobacterium iners]